MRTLPQNEFFPDSVPAPGKTLLEILEEKGMTQVELAERTGRPKKTINEIIKGKISITHETALQFELVLGAPAVFWTSLEQQYREFLARLEEQKKYGRAVAWLRDFPIPKLINMKWIEKKGTKAEQVRELLQFFGVASPNQWKDLYQFQRAAFRKPAKFSGNTGAISAWLRAGELQAQQIQCESFSRRKFIEVLTRARSFTIEKDINESTIKLRDECAKAGVAVVFVRQIPGAGVSGATRWVAKDKALIQLSLRYKTNDHLWFTFYHEAGHILFHGKKLIFLEGQSRGVAKQEVEADKFASNILINPSVLAEFVQSCSNFSKKRICEFSSRIGIAPGIVVGRLQHDGLVPYSNFNGLKVRLEWADRIP